MMLTSIIAIVIWLKSVVTDSGTLNAGQQPKCFNTLRRVSRLLRPTRYAHAAFFRSIDIILVCRDQLFGSESYQLVKMNYHLVFLQQEDKKMEEGHHLDEAGDHQLLARLESMPIRCPLRSISFTVWFSEVQTDFP